MDYCGNCGFPLSPSEERCTYCGADASRPCPHCGAAVPRTSTGTCAKCGARLEPGGPPPPAPPQLHYGPAASPSPPTPVPPPGAGLPQYHAVGAGATHYSPLGPGADRSPLPSAATAPAAPPRLSDPVEMLALELGISHLKAKRLVDAGIAVEHLRRMGEGDIARLLQDPETARVIKMRVGHQVTEREVRTELDLVKRSVEPLIRLARDLGAPAADLEGLLERASEAVGSGRPADGMQAVRRLQAILPDGRKGLLDRARREISTLVAALEQAGVDVARMRESVALIDVALAAEDPSEGVRAAQEGIAAARGASSRIDSVRRGVVRCEEVVSLLESLGKDVLGPRGELRICEGLMKGGKWEDAERAVDRIQSQAARQVQDSLAGAIVREKRRALDLKLRGQDVGAQVDMLRKSQEALRRAAVDEAVSQFRRYQETSGVARPS